MLCHFIVYLGVFSNGCDVISLNDVTKHRDVINYTLIHQIIWDSSKVGGGRFQTIPDYRVRCL